MTVSIRNRKFAKQLVLLALDEEGRVDENKVRETLDLLKLHSPRNHRDLLREYLRLIERETAKQVALVEYSGKPSDDALASLKKSLFETYGSKVDLNLRENPELLAGFRITVGDDVYEDSIANRLRPLAAALSWIRFELYLKIVT